jgi:patatin-like phospholipase/acyl hydrolase
MQIKTQDKIVQNVLRKMDERSLIGQKKYGATMMEEIEGQKKDLGRFIVDVQEELMDAILYLESARHCLKDEIEDAMYAQAKTLNENINNIHVHNEEIF